MYIKVLSCSEFNISRYIQKLFKYRIVKTLTNTNKCVKALRIRVLNYSLTFGKCVVFFS